MSISDLDVHIFCIFLILKFTYYLLPVSQFFIACDSPRTAEVLIFLVKHHYKTFFLTEICSIRKKSEKGVLVWQSYKNNK